MDESQLKQQIKIELGYPTISVEIDEAAWCVLFQRTLRWWKAKKGLIGFSVIPLIPGKTQYDPPAGSNSVIDVFLPIGFGGIQALYTQGILDTNLVPADFFGVGGYSRWGFTVSNSAYVQVLQYLEEARRVVSAEPVWEIIDGKITVIAGWSGKYTASQQEYMLVSYKKEDVELTDITDHRDTDLVYRYSLALSKMLLGRIRSKYKSYPAAGGMIDTDGPELLEEGKAEMEKLEEEISDSQHPMGFLVG